MYSYILVRDTCAYVGIALVKMCAYAMNLFVVINVASEGIITSCSWLLFVL